MQQNKKYILAFEANFTNKHFITKPFKFIIKWYEIFIEKTLPYHHMADNYHYKKCGTLINHIIGHGGESVNYKKCLKDRNSNVYAYELTCDIDIKQWHEDSVKSRSFTYDAKNALGSEAAEYKLFAWLFKKKEIDVTKQFCSENQVWKLKRQGYLPGIDRNEFSPPELIEYLIDTRLCNPNRIHVWDGKKIINNIFE